MIQNPNRNQRLAAESNRIPRISETNSRIVKSDENPENKLRWSSGDWAVSSHVHRGSDLLFSWIADWVATFFRRQERELTGKKHVISRGASAGMSSPIPTVVRVMDRCADGDSH